MSIQHGFAHQFDITPSDTVNFTLPCEAIYVGGAGNVAVVNGFGEVVTYTAPPVGTILYVKARRVNATGTTATLLRGLWGQ